MNSNFKIIISGLCLFLMFLTGCGAGKSTTANNLIINEPDPVTWIKQDGIEYYYYPSNAVIDENSLYYTGETTDSDDAVEVGQKIYKNDDYGDSLFIKNESDGSWLQYKSREKKE